MSETKDNVDTETFQHLQRLRNLRIEHRDLDEAINRLTLAPPDDQLMLRRLKKRKLLIKDRISQIERMLDPDPDEYA